MSGVVTDDLLIREYMRVWQQTAADVEQQGDVVSSLWQVALAGSIAEAAESIEFWGAWEDGAVGVLGRLQQVAEFRRAIGIVDAAPVYCPTCNRAMT